jgi:hypothetical protein
MEFLILEQNGAQIAQLNSEKIQINSVESALDILVNAYYQGAESLIIHETNLTPEFFDLKTRLAGDILQKFSNYRMRLAIVGDFEKYQSKSLHDFIYESNKSGRIFFCDNMQAALEKLK